MYSFPYDKACRVGCKCLWQCVLVSGLWMLTACSSDGHHYPSVKEEFFSGYANADSLLQYIITDDGHQRIVTDSNEIDPVPPDSLIRLMGYYEELPSGQVKIHSFVSAIAPQPVPAVQYADSVPTAPVTVQSLWLGYRYLNMLLYVKTGGKKHKIIFLEDNYTAPDADGVAHVSLSIYHKTEDDAQPYQIRGYASLPLASYLKPDVQQLNLSISFLNYDGDIRTYQFEYKP